MTDARARFSRACSSSMSSSGRKPHTGASWASARLHVDPDVAGVHRQRERLGGRQARVELVVDEQAPDVAEGHPADEVVDVDAAVAQGAALLVGLGDLGLEGDDALEAGPEVRVARRGGRSRSVLRCSWGPQSSLGAFVGRPHCARHRHAFPALVPLVDVTRRPATVADRHAGPPLSRMSNRSVASSSLLSFA